jgi:hypothetical protein
VLVSRRLRTMLCCVALQMGALAGVPMPPEQIRDLMHTLNNPKIAQTDPEAKPSADEPEPDESPAV